MRIAIISPLPPQKNGIADFSVALIKHLRLEGVTVETPLADKVVPIKTSEFEALMISISWSDYDLIHAELGGGRCDEFKTIVWLQKNFPTLRYTASLHDPERVIWQNPKLPVLVNFLPPYLKKIYSLLTDYRTISLEREFCKKLEKLIVLTSIGRDRLSKRMNLPLDKIVIIPHGCNEIHPAPMPDLPPHGPLKLIYFGFIYPGKGIEDLIDAVVLLVKLRPELESSLHLTLAGGTTPEIAFGGDNKYLHLIEQRLLNTGFTKVKIEWQLDLPTNDIPKIIQNSHLVVLPYIETKKLALLGKICGTSGVLAWANACGRGVISSDARAFSEEVSYGNGVIYPQRDIKKLASIIDDLFQTPSLIKILGEKARIIGEERAWNKIVHQYIKIFKKG